MKRVLVVLFSMGVSLVTTSVSSEGASDLVPLKTANENRGWEAVGRLNFGDVSYCTGALIDADLVLTAAHCLFDNSSGEQFAAEQIEFLPGWRNGRAEAYRHVRRVVVHPDFTYSSFDKVGRVAHDVALIQLDQPIKSPSIIPYEVDIRPHKGTTVGVVSYARERSDAASLQEECLVLARQGGVLVLSCEVDHGASGSPVFTFDEGERPKIVSVISAMAMVKDQDVALGTTLTKPLALLKEMISRPAFDETTPALSVVSRGLPTVNTFSGLSAGGDSGGAKFLKPNQ